LIFETIGAKIYAVISHGLHEKLQFIAFFELSGVISMFNKSNTTLTIIIINIHIPNELQNNNVQKMKQFHNKIDSFNHQYGML
jgi:hypothetical protein